MTLFNKVFYEDPLQIIVVLAVVAMKIIGVA